MDYCEYESVYISVCSVYGDVWGLGLRKGESIHTCLENLFILVDP